MIRLSAPTLFFIELKFAARLFRFISAQVGRPEKACNLSKLEADMYHPDLRVVFSLIVRAGNLITETR